MKVDGKKLCSQFVLHLLTPKQKLGTRENFLIRKNSLKKNGNALPLINMNTTRLDHSNEDRALCYVLISQITTTTTGLLLAGTDRLLCIPALDFATCCSKMRCVFNHTVWIFIRWRNNMVWTVVFNITCFTLCVITYAILLCGKITLCELTLIYLSLVRF